MRGGLIRRMILASGLLALVVGAVFAVLLSLIADLRASEARAAQSAEVLVIANRLERLVVDLAACPPRSPRCAGRIVMGDL